MRAASEFDRQTVTRNIEAILKLEEDDERRLSALHRGSHKVGWFVGTVYFVIIQAVFVLLWILWNAYAASQFDPYPFPLLSAVLALEAVLLTSFVLIRQNSMDLQSERRNHLDLQINLLAEREATSILKASERSPNDSTSICRAKQKTRIGEDHAILSIARDLRSRNSRAFVQRRSTFFRTNDRFASLNHFAERGKSGWKSSRLRNF
jgi:hypothetical protein